MATVILSVPEEYLLEVITVIRAGLAAQLPAVSDVTRKHLTQWCDDEEEYARGVDDAR